MSSNAQGVERRLYFPANGASKEAALGHPIQVTFDKVESIPTPRIGILPLDAYEADGQALEDAQPSSAQHQMQLSMGQVKLILLQLA